MCCGEIIEEHIVLVINLVSRDISGNFIVFTVRRSALHGLVIVILSVRLSVRLSVCHTRGLCPHGSTYDYDFFTVW